MRHRPWVPRGALCEVELTTDGLQLYNAIGYLYAEEILNNACKIYGYGTVADTHRSFSYEIGDGQFEIIEVEAIVRHLEILIYHMLIVVLLQLQHI